MAAVTLPQTEREINGKRYLLTALAAKPGRAMLVRLTKVVGPGLAKALKAAGGGRLLEADVSVLGDGVAELCKTLSEDDFEHVCSTFLKQTMVMGGGGGFVVIQDYDAFAADYGTLFKLLAAHIEHNYASFLAGLRITGR
jgi:hypothetical protein